MITKQQSFFDVVDGCTEFLQRKGVVRFPAYNGKTETSMMLGTPVKATGLSERPGVAKRVDAAGTQKYGSYPQYIMYSSPIVGVVLAPCTCCELVCDFYIANLLCFFFGGLKLLTCFQVGRRAWFRCHMDQLCGTKWSQENIGSRCDIMRLWWEAFWEPHGSVFFVSPFCHFMLCSKMWTPTFPSALSFLPLEFQSQTAKEEKEVDVFFRKSALGFSNATQTSATQGEVPPSQELRRIHHFWSPFQVASG